MISRYGYAQAIVTMPSDTSHEGVMPLHEGTVGTTQAQVGVAVQLAGSGLHPTEGADTTAPTDCR